MGFSSLSTGISTCRMALAGGVAGEATGGAAGDGFVSYPFAAACKARIASRQSAVPAGAKRLVREVSGAVDLTVTAPCEGRWTNVNSCPTTNPSQAAAVIGAEAAGAASGIAVATPSIATVG